MIRFALAATVLALAACAPPIPDSGAGVGFEDYKDYNSYRAARDAELRGPYVPATVVPPQDSDRITAATLTEAGIGTPGAAPVPASPSVTATAPVQPGTRATAVDPNNPRISDEQDFSAVANRQSIQSDAERLRAQREAYEVIAPTALPSRGGSDGPNIVQYALSSRNAVGERVYRRSGLAGNARYQRNCNKYSAADQAQEAFLRSGGPERDRMGLDPDGDGFACSWDPTPFRRATAGRG